MEMTQRLTGEKCQHCARVAFSATVHCLTGCAIGEVLGLAIATTVGLADVPSIVLAVVLAFVFGYSLTMRPLLSAGIGLSAALGTAFAADTLSIAVMELVDNAIILAIPGAMDAGLDDILFWGSLVFALAVAFSAAFPLNLFLVSRGWVRAEVHAAHGSGERHELAEMAAEPVEAEHRH